MKRNPTQVIQSKASRPDRREGQAMAEFVVALVVLIVLFAGILHIGALGLARNGCMALARRYAGDQAMQPVAPAAYPRYMADRTVGADRSGYSADDGYLAGYAGDLYSRGLIYARPDQLGLYRPGNPLTVLARSPAPEQLFGLTDASASATVPLLPVVRTLIYARDSVRVEGKAWMVWTEGIY